MKPPPNETEALASFLCHFDADERLAMEFVQGLDEYFAAAAGKVSLAQWTELVLDMIGAERVIAKEPDGTTAYKYRRGDVYAAIDLVRACFEWERVHSGATPKYGEEAGKADG